jgi:hypothetical protein
MHLVYHEGLSNTLDMAFPVYGDPTIPPPSLVQNTKAATYEHCFTTIFEILKNPSNLYCTKSQYSRPYPLKPEKDPNTPISIPSKNL